MVAASVVLSTGLAIGADSSPSRPVLHLRNGDFAAGTLVDSADRSKLSWQCAAALRPFQFPLSAINSVTFSNPPVKAKGDFCVELAGGGFIVGSLVSLTPQFVSMETTHFRQLQVRREQISRITICSPGARLFIGPQGLLGWDKPDESAGWHEEAGALVTDRPRASLYGDFHLPLQARIELEVSWNTKPDFVLAFAVDGNGSKATRDSYRMECLDGHLVAIREVNNIADLAELDTLPQGPGHIHLQTYLDQKNGRLLVYSADGHTLGELKELKIGNRLKARTGIQLVNNTGNVRLDLLRISRWNGESPQDLTSAAPRVCKEDGTQVNGEIQAFDPDRKRFTIKTPSGETRIEANEITSLVLGKPEQSQPLPLQAVLLDGSRIRGNLDRVEHGRLYLTSPSVPEPLEINETSLQALFLTASASGPQQTGKLVGRWETDGVRLTGSLADSESMSEEHASCLVWNPQFSTSGSPLRKGIAGRIVYRELPPPPRQPQALSPQQRALAIPRAAFQPAAVVAGGLIRTPISQPASPVGDNGQAIYLRTGDMIPCRVNGIVEGGVTLESPITEARFVPNEKIKAVQLSSENPAPLDKIRRERLLTVPRMQKNNPPTHLVVSTNGDYLRGRLIEIDSDKLTIEVHLETKQLSRNNVARIIWFHPDELDESKRPAGAAAELSTKVQVVRNDGRRLTFSPERTADSVLTGTSDVLGPCKADLRQVDQLLIGNAIDDKSVKRPFQTWKLHNAVEPQFASDSQNPDSQNSGLQSPFVGKPAPDFELSLLAGDKFRLSQQKGRIIVLDFWASWCGFCVQSMPEIERVIHEFKDEDVKLVSVNMQEDSKTISRFLERSNMQPTVVLDTDGVAADRYSVSSIPQTVIIDAKGNVARLYIGANNIAEQLRTALKELAPKGAGGAAGR
jgi:thiol-disulfide isomerase/thioredoxin